MTINWNFEHQAVVSAAADIDAEAFWASRLVADDDQKSSSSFHK